MGKSILCNDKVSVKSSFFGLCEQVIYLPTGSKMQTEIKEYDLVDADKLQRILNMECELVAKELQKVSVKPCELGNARLEILKSKDGACVMMQLFRYMDFNFEPVTDFVILDGQDAAVVSKLF